MKSKIAEMAKMKYSPVAVLWADEKPEPSMQFKPGRWGCVMFLLARAAKGKPAVADRETFGCLGGGVGLGFGNMYENFPGSIEHYISTGNAEFCATEQGRIIAQGMPELEHGERYVSSPESAREFIRSLPIRDVPSKYVVMKPLELVDEDEKPRTIVFCANPDQISALTVLASYRHPERINVIAPFGAGCHQVGIIPYREAESDHPRAVLGLTDISARKNIMKMLDHNVLSFTVPYSKYLEMEQDAEGSFLEKDSWAAVAEHAEKES